MKEELIKHLQTKEITSILSLWGEVKDYYKNKSILMGGGYASWNSHININLNVNGNRERFSVSLDECKN